MIKLGSNSIGKIYLGSNSIGKAYLGDDLVFQKGATPSIQPVLYDYIVFDGDCGIETDIVLPQNCSIRVSIGNESIKAQQGVFNAGDSTEGSIRLFYGASTSESGGRNIAIYYDSTSFIAADQLLFSTSRFAFLLTPNGYGWPAYFVPFTKGSMHPSGKLTIGSMSGSNRYSGKMATFWIFGPDAASCQDPYAILNDYTPVYRLIPCTYNGQPGLWSETENKFYGKTLGSGTLVVTN